MTPFILGLFALALAFWWIIRLKRKDTADCQAILGLEAAPATTTRGTTPEGLEYSQTMVLAGTLHGRPAVLFERFARHPNVSRRTRRGSHFTVLELTLERPARVPIRLQPVGMLGSIEAFVHGAPTDVVAVDPDFDAAYTVYSSQPAEAVVLLEPGLRARILAFRMAAAGVFPGGPAARLASGLQLGTLQVEGTFARYVLFGSPAKATATQVKAAVPLLLELAGAASAG